MKSLKKICSGLLSATLLFGSVSCASLNNTGKGAMIGGGGGAALGAGLGALIGGGKGAAIGTAIGAAVGAGAGTMIGHKMDAQQKQLEKIQGAQVEQTTDQNGLQAIKVTFEGGILFPSGKWTLSPKAQTSLSEFASSLLQNPDTNVDIYGFTDNTGGLEINQEVSTQRANAVEAYLIKCGVPGSRMTAKGFPMTDYIASNDTPEGRAQNRRVEIYITANKKMIQEAEAGTLK